MNKIGRDFISEEPHKFEFKLGSFIASSLSGFIAGVVVASIVWSTVIVVLKFLL